MIALKHPINKFVIRELLSDITNFPLAIFGFNKFGSNVILQDFYEWPHSEKSSIEIDKLIQDLAINSIHDYGLLNDFKENFVNIITENILGYRILLVSLNLDYLPLRENENYRQIAIFIPEEISEVLPPLSIFQESLINIIKDIISQPFQYSPHLIMQMKSKILMLLTFVIFENINIIDN